MPDQTFFSTSNQSRVGKSSSLPVSGIRKSSGGSRFFKKFGIAGVVILIAAAGFALGLYVTTLKPALSLLTNVNQLKADMNRIKSAAAERDLVEMNAALTTTEKDLHDLRAARDENAAWLSKYSFSKGYYNDSEHFINAGLHAIDAGRIAIELMKPFADAGGFKVEEGQEVVKTGLADAVANWIAIMPQIATDIDPVLEKLTLAGDEIAQVDASRYPESFRGVEIRSNIEAAQKSLSLLNDAGPDIKEALQVIPPLMGVGEGEKRYMILFQNDKEIRATGGFWTYVSTFKLNNGLLASDFSSNGTYNVDFALETVDKFYTFPTVPQAYRDHLKVERMFARDANIEPDLATAADQFMLFWELAIPYSPDFKPVDGVITIDTRVLEELLEITGPVTLNGVTYNPETVTVELEKIASLALREQANRKRILGDLMELMLQNVFESDKNLWPKLVDKGIDLALRKHIQAVVFDPRGQALLDKYNFSGRVVDDTEGDYAFVVSTNLGGGKTNGWFVNKTVDHKLEREGNRFMRTTTVKFNYGTKEALYDPFIQIYQDWVRLYVPAGSELISVDGSQDPVSSGTLKGRDFFGGYVTLNQGETKELVFKYYLPDGLIKDNAYKLYLQKQSGIDKELHTVTVNGSTQNVELSTDEEVEVTL